MTVLAGSRGKHSLDRTIAERDECLADSFNLSMDLSTLPHTRSPRLAYEHSSDSDREGTRAGAAVGGSTRHPATIQQFEDVHPPEQAGSNNPNETQNYHSTSTEESLFGSVASFVSVPSVG
jgi:hypothetical protein